MSDDFGHEDCSVCDAAREAEIHKECRERIAALAESQKLTDSFARVAWLRYVREAGITRVVVCDSDVPGAFRVYRRTDIDDARVES